VCMPYVTVFPEYADLVREERMVCWTGYQALFTLEYNCTGL